MPTLTQFRQRMLQLEPALGRVEAIASLTTTTIVVNALAVGTVLTGKFKAQWALRPETASAADRLRFLSDYTSASGTLTHAGTNYADTTATDEEVEIHEFEPYLLDQAIQEAVRTFKRRDQLYLPGRLDGIYELSALDWIDHPSQITRTGRRTTPVLTDNRAMEKWNVVSSAGVLQPDLWTLAGAGATFARSTSRRRGRYSLSVTRSGTETIVSVAVDINITGVGADSLRGQEVVPVLVSRAASASSSRVRVTSDDASNNVLSTLNSEYHTGGGDWEELVPTTAHTVHDDADHLTLSARGDIDEEVLLDELYLNVGALSDTIRRDNTRILWDSGAPKLTQNPLTWMGSKARNAQVVIESQRPFAAFDATRLNGGTADADSSDAPLDEIATLAIATFYTNRAEGADGTALDGNLARRWGGKSADVRGLMLGQDSETQHGMPILTGTPYGVRARV